MQPKRRKRNSLIPWIVALFIGIGFPCGTTGAQSPEKKTVKIEREKPATPPEKAAEEISEKKTAEGVAAEEKEPYSYDPTNKPDPFKSFIVVRRELEEEREREEPLTYLETLDLSQLTLTAIVTSEKKKWALVQDSKGEGHVIGIGTPMGRKRGKVTEIRETEIVVVEHDMDYRGNEILNSISLKLPEVE